MNRLAWYLLIASLAVKFFNPSWEYIYAADNIITAYKIYVSVILVCFFLLYDRVVTKTNALGWHTRSKTMLYKVERVIGLLLVAYLIAFMPDIWLAIILGASEITSHVARLGFKDKLGLV